MSTFLLKFSFRLGINSSNTCKMFLFLSFNLGKCFWCLFLCSVYVFLSLVWRQLQWSPRCLCMIYEMTIYPSKVTDILSLPVCRKKSHESLMLQLGWHKNDLQLSIYLNCAAKQNKCWSNRHLTLAPKSGKISLPRVGAEIIFEQILYYFPPTLPGISVRHRL